MEILDSEVNEWKIDCAVSTSLDCSAQVTLAHRLKWCEADSKDFAVSFQSGDSFSETVRTFLRESTSALDYILLCFQKSFEEWQVNLPMFGVWFAAQVQQDIAKVDLYLPIISLRNRLGEAFCSHFGRRAFCPDVTLKIPGFELDAEVILDSQRLLIKAAVKAALLPMVPIEMDATYSPPPWSKAWAAEQQSVELGALLLLGRVKSKPPSFPFFPVLCKPPRF